jgi:hypothetical protein
MLSCGVSPGSSRLPRRAERPVQVLARAVDAGEGLLVQQAGQAVLLGDALSVIMMICWWSAATLAFSYTGASSYWPGGHFVVAGLDRHAQLEQLALRVQHAGEHALGNRAEVLVLELLALGRLGAEQRAAAEGQVGAGEEEVAVDQEVLLLGAGVANT